MIRIIHRCMTESKLTEKNWNGHFAFMHLNEFKNAKELYLNGKRLKWFNRFKNGDVIEVIDRPKDLFTMIGAALFGSILFGASTTTFTVLGVLAVAGIVGTVATIGTAIFNSFNRGSTTTQNKEYSSATQPELRGASNDISNDIIPVTFGTVQQTPSYAQTPYRLVQDGTGKNKYHQYFIANYDNVVYSDYKLGETPITNYEDTYYDINTAYGLSTFIGYDNCKALSIDEELSYDKDAQIYEGNWVSPFATATNSARVTSEKVNVSIYFDADNTAEFDTTKFTSKTYTVKLIYNGTTQTRSFTISSVGYVDSEGHLYPVGTTPSVTFSMTFPAASTPSLNIFHLEVSADGDTRQNSYEVLHGLTATLEFAAITVGSYSHSFDVDFNITKYNIIPSEVIQTSPPNTTDIDVIISFPQGLYKINANSGNRLSRSAALSIQYKGIDENTWHELDEATSIYIRDIDNVKQPLSSSSTTYSSGIITVYSPDDIKIADQLFFRPIGFELPAGQYNVRVRCADFKDKTNYDVGVPHCSEIQFRCTGDVVNPVVLPKTTQLAFEVTAYKNLSGTLKKFNYIAKTAIPTLSNDIWSDAFQVGTDYWNGVTYAYDLTDSDNKFIAVGNNGYIAHSANGLNWTTPVQVGTDNWNGIINVYYPSLNHSYIYVAGNNGYIARSGSGDTWSVNQVDTVNWQSIAHGNNINVAVGNIGANSYASTNSSGNDWTTPVQIGNYVTVSDIAYGNNKFVAVLNNYVKSSTDGVNWATGIYTGTEYWSSIAYGNNKFVMVGGGSVTTSTDGDTWTTPVTIASYTLRSVKYENNKFIAAGYNGVVLTSTDGDTWTTEQADTVYWNDIAYGNSKYVVVGFNGYIAKKDIKDYVISSNPAMIIKYLLTDDKVNPRAESLSHIDDDSLAEYYTWCESEGYKADGVISEACKIGEVVNEILKNTQCAMIPLYNGKHTFVIDKPNKTPVGLFNQHNSWNFKWTPNIGRQTEAIRASFVENDDWTQDELTLYWYDGAVHDEPKAGTSDLDYEMVKKEYKYVSDRASVRKIVAYELETIQTKRNQFEFDVNLEAMNMMLLDRIYISNTANMQNESTGLIKATITENGYLKGFELYSPVNIPQNAKIVIRSLDYDNHKTLISTFDVINSGESSTVNITPVWISSNINAQSIKGAGEITGLQDTWYYDGDLFTLGQDTIYDCTVTDIKYNDDGTATITARDYGFGVNEGA